MTKAPTEETKEPATARIRDALGRLLPSSAWRYILGFAVATLTFACTTGGLFVVFPGVQSALVAGVAAGLIVGRPLWASGVVAGAAGLLGSLAGPQNAWFAASAGGQRLLAAVVAAAACAAVALAVRWCAARWSWSARVLLAAALVVLVGNLWYTTYNANSESLFDPITGTEMPSFNDQLAGDVPEAIAGSDDAYFYRVYEQVRAGKPYYAVFAQALEDNPDWAPASVADFRMPTFFWLAHVMGPPDRMVAVFLALATAAILSVVPLTSTYVKTPLALPACAALAAYFVYFPIQMTLFSQEAWAAALGIGALSASAYSARTSRWRAWATVSVGCAVVAVLFRETMVFLPLAGLASVIWVRNEQRMFRLIAWVAGCCVLAAAYAAHYFAVRPYLNYAEGFEKTGKGSVEFMAAAFDYATDFLGQGGALPLVLALLGLAGVLLVPETRQRVFAIGGTFVPLASFLYVGNLAWYETTGQAINYWGAGVLPLAYAMVPIAFVILPGTPVSVVRRPDS